MLELRGCQKGPWWCATSASGLPVQSSWPWLRTARTALRLRRDNRRHRGLATASCEWLRTPHAAGAPSTYRGPPGKTMQQTPSFQTEPWHGETNVRHINHILSNDSVLSTSSGKVRKNAWLKPLSRFSWEHCVLPQNATDPCGFTGFTPVTCATRVQNGQTRSRVHSSTTGGRARLPAGRRLV